MFCNVKPSIDNYVQDPVLRNAPDLGDVEDGIEANSEQKLNSEEEILKAGKGSYFTMKIIIFADKFIIWNVYTYVSTVKIQIMLF